MQPADYAYQWCNTLIGEPSECKRGVDYASNNLQNRTPGQVIQDCTDSASIDGFSTSDAFRYGCYLNSAFQGSSKNICTTSMNIIGTAAANTGTTAANTGTTDTSSGDNSTQTSVTFGMPCADMCRTVYDSNAGNLNVCMSSAQNQFDQSVQNGKCGDPTTMLSCIDGLYKSGSGYDCQPNSADFNNVCKPSVIGCVFGTMQSGFLNQVQQYQTSNGLDVTSCTRPPSNTNTTDNNNNTPNSDWNPWPEGSTYS